MEVLALVQALLIILFVGGLSLLAQWGRKNREAEIGLIFVLVIFSLLVVILGPLVAFVGRSGPAPGLSPELYALSSVVIALAGLVGLALCVPPLRKVFRRRHATADQPSGDRFGWWSDPPIFFALWMSVIVLAINAISLLAFALVPDTVGSALASVGRLSPVTVALGELPLAIIALCGVGLGVRRGLRETLDRLGYGSVTVPQLGIVALFVVGALLLSFAADALFAALQPDLYERVGEISEGLFDPEGLSPLSAVLFALLIGVGAGLGEETLFRGAVQPALGITLASILFASMHVQYGPSLLLGYLFVLSVGLGLLRKHINTTASFLAHAAYNSLGVLLT
jgi:membrane protease YdiL (CAAX protease family)